MSCQAKSISGVFAIFVFLLMFVMNCDKVQRHKVLTFFFDGVPPLETETALSEEGSAEARAETSAAEQRLGQPKTVVFVHEPRKDCHLCHKRLEKGRWAVPEFTKPVPALCYDCHTDYTLSAAFVHGPVAVGQCLFCHNPHKSKNEHLLNDPEPQLCYLCHDRDVIESIANHSTETLSECTNCHDAHAALEKSLLRKDWKEKAN